MSETELCACCPTSLLRSMSLLFKLRARDLRQHRAGRGGAKLFARHAARNSNDEGTGKMRWVHTNALWDRIGYIYKFYGRIPNAFFGLRSVRRPKNQLQVRNCCAKRLQGYRAHFHMPCHTRAHTMAMPPSSPRHCRHERKQRPTTVSAKASENHRWLRFTFTATLCGQRTSSPDGEVDLSAVFRATLGLQQLYSQHSSCP